MRLRFTSSRTAVVISLIVCVAASVGAGVASSRAKVSVGPSAHATFVQGCADRYPAERNPANPLDLRRPPGPNPLHGARFFVPGPAEGNAASTIAALVSDPYVSPTESWAQFHRQLTTGRVRAKLARDPRLAREVALLSKIAAQPQSQRISSVSAGGSPQGIFAQTQKIFCSVLPEDPGTIPIFTTYFLHSTLGGSPTPAQVKHYMPLFKAQINAMAQATGRRPAVFLLELDALGSSSGVKATGALPAWEAALRYELDRMEALPHTVVYVEGGYSDSNSVSYTASILRAIDIHHVRGFFTNDTHNNWTSDEDRWATAVAHQAGGTHYIVNTASNGQGPKVEADHQEDLCNPPGRGLGIRDTVKTGWALADAYLWEHTPGASSGCLPGSPPSGTFWPSYAEGLAARADSRLGPTRPSKPY